MEKAHVVIVRGLSEDVSWIHNIDYSFTLLSFSKEKRGQVGEFLPFYKWIYDNYDNLPEYLILAHAHRNSWHCTVNIDELINNLSFDHKFKNINIFSFNEEQTYFNSRQLDVDRSAHLPKDVEYVDYFSKFLEYKFNSFLELFGIDWFPAEEVIGRKCGQCYVSRDLILSKSKDFWKKLINFFYFVPIKLYEERPDIIQFFIDYERHSLEYPCSVLFEIINHYIFTGIKDYRKIFSSGL